MSKYLSELSNRRINTPSCVLVLYAIAMGASTCISYNITFSLVTFPEGPSCWDTVPQTSIAAEQVVPTLQNFAIIFFFPLLGWISDIKIGRERGIRMSLWFCWVGTLLQLASYCVQYGTCGFLTSAAKYCISGIALILLMLGTAGIYTNILPYGLDQLTFHSNAQVRAFVHWMVWGLFLGFCLTGHMAFVEQTLYNPSLTMITCLISFAIVSLGVSITYLIDSFFLFSGPMASNDNPYTDVFNVLKYAWNHNYHTRRSAFTYYDNNLPGRLDLAKMKYGGSFEEEKVEDVKTFLRMCFIFLSMFGLYISYFSVFNGILPYLSSLRRASALLDGFGSYFMFTMTHQVLMIVLVPVFELILIPLFPKLEYFLLNPLRGLMLSSILLVLTLTSTVCIDIVAHYRSSQEYNCEFGSLQQSLNLNFLFYLLPLVLSGLINVLNFVCTMEFICCQGPKNMYGMLCGIFWLLRGLYMNIGGLISAPFTIEDVNGPGKLSCSSWILFTQLAISIIGVIVFLIVVTKYEKRKKKDEYNYYVVVEEHYDQFLRNKQNKSTPSVITK